MNDSQSPSPERRGRGWITLVFLTGFVALAFFYDPAQGGSFSLCLFRRWVGLPCPACGITRSVCVLMKGQVYDALRFHPLGPVAALVFIGAWLREMVVVGMDQGRSPLARRCQAVANRVDEFFRRPLVIWFGIALLLIVWIIRVGWLGWRDPR